MSVESYIHRLDNILDKIKNYLLSDGDKNTEILDCINEALPENEQEAMARHMLRRLIYSIKQRKDIILATYSSYWLLLDIGDIVKYLSQYKNIRWNRAAKFIKWYKVDSKYYFEEIPPENEDEFEEVPYDFVSKWKKQ